MAEGAAKPAGVPVVQGAAGPTATQVLAWRHPKACGAAGRCIGQTDLPVDPRKAKRLAHRIRAVARREGFPRAVTVSALRRARDVGRWLARWGWQVQVDARLNELNFGAWDGLPWSAIAWSEVQAWQDDLLHHAPGGGEPLAALAARVRAFLAAPAPAVRLVVTHGGWLNAWLHVPADATAVAAAAWPPAPPHASLVRVPLGPGRAKDLMTAGISLPLV
jgi:alpha-ribazole phosphatase